MRVVMWEGIDLGASVKGVSVVGCVRRLEEAKASAVYVLWCAKLRPQHTVYCDFPTPLTHPPTQTPELMHLAGTVV